MKLILALSLFLVTQPFYAQDDIYDRPEPVKPARVYNDYSSSNDNYENVQDDYNPNYDYRYRRSLRRMYDPYYVMPASAYMNMYSYPQFNSFYNPYWNSGFSITIGNGWGNSWGNPWMNSWNDPWNSWGYGWNNPYGWNAWNGGWNNSMYYGHGWNSWGCNSRYNGWNNWNSWNNPYNNWGYNNHRPSRPQNNYINVDGQPARSNVNLPTRRLPRANGRYENPNNSGSVFYRNSNGNGNNSNSGNNNNGGSFNNNNSNWGNSNSNRSSSPSMSTPSNNNTPSAPSRSGGTAPRSGRF